MYSILLESMGCLITQFVQGESGSLQIEILMKMGRMYLISATMYSSYMIRCIFCQQNFKCNMNKVYDLWLPWGSFS